jgi:8-oxo-dGTP diphosphatase
MPIIGPDPQCLDVEIRRRQILLPSVLVSAVALIDADGRVLISKRPEGKTMPGLWEFPGGKVEEKETPEDALIRELKEELGLDIAESCLAALSFASHAYTDFHLLMPLFVCRVWRGDPEPKEGQEIRWVRPMRLGDYAMPPADNNLVSLLQDFL